MSEDPDDEDDPFASMDAPDDDSDPFENLAGATDDAPDDGADGTDRQVDDRSGDTDRRGTDAGDQNPTGPGPGPGRLDDDPFTTESADRDTSTDDEVTGDAWASTDTGDARDSGTTDAATSESDDGADTIAAGTGEEDGDLFTEMASQQTGSAADEAEDPFEAFESPDVDEVDPDEIWDRLSQAESEDATTFDEKVYYEVSKHRFCEQCEYFSGPPEAACTYEGADIVEFLDMETVRLVNCPVVAEHRELGNE